MGEQKRRADALGDQPIQEQYHRVMNALARGLDSQLNSDVRQGDRRKVGFTLLVYPFDSTDGRCNFISNGARREDLVVLFKEMIARFEGQPEIAGRA